MQSEGTTATQLPECEAVFLGIKVHAMNVHQLTALVETGISNGKKWIVANHNLHSLYLLHRTPKLRQFFELAQWTHIDGMPLIALARRYGYKVDRSQRVTYVDWTPLLFEAAARRHWRVFYLGSAPGTAEIGFDRLQAIHPDLVFEFHHGYFDQKAGSAENTAVLDRIVSFAPDLLMVGMGMPRQEIWILDNYPRLNAKVILPCGAAIDYVAGVVPTPPRWAGQLGLEWAFRLCSEPRRLARRYLIEPWYILYLILKDRVGL